ncbi:hypothetical protein MCAP1_001135 [Malassezia caprae]|uniref:HTH APSES-type domain-containing protein n=1 Tax=Malassezia caprae TaxID=1381934 RepID=A0AAF0IVM9_9BASI|nr:hypothetical protein MCAP1_001135 [Malassezia caprae]
MPPRRSTPRKGRAESTDSAPATEAATDSPVTTPRRTTRGRRATTKAAALEEPVPPVPKPKTKSTSRARTTKAEKEAEAKAEKDSAVKSEPDAEPESTDSAVPVERMHKLPTRTNPRLSEVKSRQVKLQVIRREDKEIIIGRIKLPTVNGAEHGFLLKRCVRVSNSSFDTNAIAGSSMFRLAFPFAESEEESAEMAYLESRFNTDVANGGFLPAPRTRGRKPASSRKGTLPPGSTGVRLQGVWIPCEEALSIASDYGLKELAQPLIHATAVLPPNEEVPILNPGAETLAAIKNGEKIQTEQPATPVRQTKRARTVRESASTTSTPLAAVEELVDVPAATTGRRSTRRQARATAAEAPPPAENPMTSASVEEQIAEAKRLAAQIQSEARNEAPQERASAKRRAEDEDEDAPAEPQAATGRVTRALRKHRRPIAGAAGMLTAAGAVGLGAMALYSGNINLSSTVPNMLQQLQQVDYASALQTIQQNIQNWAVSSWFG